VRGGERRNEDRARPEAKGGGKPEGVGKVKSCQTRKGRLQVNKLQTEAGFCQRRLANKQKLRVESGMVHKKMPQR